MQNVHLLPLFIPTCMVCARIYYVVKLLCTQCLSVLNDIQHIISGLWKQSQTYIFFVAVYSFSSHTWFRYNFDHKDWCITTVAVEVVVLAAYCCLLPLLRPHSLAWGGEGCVLSSSEPNFLAEWFYHSPFCTMMLLSSLNIDWNIDLQFIANYFNYQNCNDNFVKVCGFNLGCNSSNELNDVLPCPKKELGFHWPAIIANVSLLQQLLSWN